MEPILELARGWFELEVSMYTVATAISNGSAAVRVEPIMVSMIASTEILSAFIELLVMLAKSEVSSKVWAVRAMFSMEVAGLSMRTS